MRSAEAVGDGVNTEATKLGHLDGGVVGVVHNDLTKRARVHEAKFFGLGARKVQHDMGVQGARR